MSRSWPRPVPLIGDTSSAAARSADPAGWAFPDEVGESLAQVIAGRRDIRRFRPDPVPEPLVTKVLTAAHRAPSVGHSQPWRFIVVTDPGTRERAATMADSERLRQARQLEPDAARRLLDLQLEGIREAPLGIVVCCDRRTNPEGVLGRATFTDSDMWSCAAAIENAWLTARAHGLGLGWVTLFEPAALATLMNLPDGVETLGWLCLGWPDERPPEPGLERAAWSRRQPLGDVVFRERWPNAKEPAPPPSAVRAPDQTRVVTAKDDADTLLTPGESLGVLDRAVNRVIALSDEPPATGTLVLVAADHPVARHRVSAYDARVTADVFEATLRGMSLGATAARAAGLATRAIDAGVGVGGSGDSGSGDSGSGDSGSGDSGSGDSGSGDSGSGDSGSGDASARVGSARDSSARDSSARNASARDASGTPPDTSASPTRAHDPRGDLAGADAMTIGDTRRLIEAGRRIGAESARHGLVVLGEVGVANTTVAAALAAYLLDEKAAAAVGLGAASDAAMVERKRAVVDAALIRARNTIGRDARTDEIIATLGGPDVAILTGVTTGAAAGGAAVVLDGLLTSVAALLAVREEPGVAASLIAGQRSRERAHDMVLTALGLEPLLDLRTRSGEGVGGCLAAQLLLSGLAIRKGAARTEHPAEQGRM